MKGTITNAALVVEIDGELRQAMLSAENCLFLVRLAQSLSDGMLNLGEPIQSIKLQPPRPCLKGN